MMIDDGLPPNATDVEKQMASSFARLSTLPVAINTLWDADQCPDDLLPWLAWALSVDTWRADWPVAIQRQVIRNSVQVHRYKGTVYAIKQALAAMTLAVNIVEWFDTASPAHTFVLQTTLTPAQMHADAQRLTREQHQFITQTVDAIKPARSHYHLEAQVTWHSTVGVGNHFTAVQIIWGQLQLNREQHDDQ